MGRNLYSVSLVFLLVLFTIGCETKSVDSNSDPKENQVELATNYDSALREDSFLSLEEARSLYFSTGAMACDEINRDYSFDIIQALKSKRQLIAQDSPKSESSEDTDSRGPRDVVIRDSWAKLHTFFSRNRNSKSAKLWQKIYRRATTLYFEDSKRIRGQSHPLLYKDNRETLEKALREVQTCLDLDSCHIYDFSRRSIYFFKEGPRHRALWNDYYNNIGTDRSKVALSDLESLLLKDLNHYVFQKNDSVELKNQRELHIKLNLQGLGEDDIEQLNRALDEWSYGEHHISFSHAESGAKIIDNKIQGGRSFYNRSQNTIVLRQGWNHKTLAHELGHLIGFPDKYYSSFNNIECFYQFEFNTSDIMASSQSGNVGFKHWSKVLENY